MGPGWRHGSWRLPAIAGTPHGRHFPPVVTILVLSPSKRYQQHASARSSHRLVAPSCCPSARGRRSGPVPAGQALWMPHVRHVGRPSAQQVRATAMGCGASTGTCAACAALVCLLGVGLPPHATTKHDSTTAPPRPADASRPASIAGGVAELALLRATAQGSLPASGKARCARCARRDRPGAPWGRATPLRQPSPPRRGFASMCAPDPNPDPNPNRRLPCGDHRCAALHGGVGGVPVSILRLLGRYSYGSGRDHVPFRPRPSGRGGV